MAKHRAIQATCRHQQLDLHVDFDSNRARPDPTAPPNSVGLAPDFKGIWKPWTTGSGTPGTTCPCYRRVLTLVVVDATLTGFLGFPDVFDQDKNQAKRPVLSSLRSPQNQNPEGTKNPESCSLGHQVQRSPISPLNCADSA